MVHVTDDKDNCEITCWINNCPSGFEKGDGYFIVNNIRQVKYGKRKSKTTDKWFDSIDVELDISPCKPDTSFDDAVVQFTKKMYDLENDLCKGWTKTHGHLSVTFTDKDDYKISLSIRSAPSYRDEMSRLYPDPTAY